MSEVLAKAKRTLVPSLRFKEYDGEWTEKKLNDIAEFKKGKGISKADISDDGILECIRYGELYTTYTELIKDVVSKTDLPKTDLILSEFNDVIIPASGESNIDIATASCVLKTGVAYSGDLNIIRSKINGIFLSFYLNNKKKFDIARLAQGVSVVHLYSSQLKTLKINLPSLPEPQKIASFLSAVDEKIQQLTKKKALLEDYKKGVMQQLFSGKLRFKDANGKNYPDWEEKKMVDIMAVRNDQAPKSDEYPLMAFIKHIGVAPKGDRYNREFLVNDGDGKKYKKTEYGDFIYSSNNLDTGSIGLNRYGSACISPVYSIFQIKELCDYQFISKFLVRKSFINKMLRFRQGVVYGQWKIHETAVLTIKEKIPCLEEQQKIASYLSRIDTKIEAVNHQITQTQQFKKGLLQQMFV